MTKPTSLETLSELAQTHVDEAARLLGTLISHGTAMENKLQILLHYREEYSKNLHASGQNGMSITGWRNFQEFITKLDTAIEQQRQALTRAHECIQDGKQKWQEAQRTLKAYDTLSQRRSHIELQRTNKLEQKETDEHAGKSRKSDQQF